MRKITQQAIEAFLNARTNGNVFNKSNTFVIRQSRHLVELYLHHSCIAKIEHGVLYINPQNWKTSTTKERLNGLPNVNIAQKDYVWYLNGSNEPMAMNTWTRIG